MQMRDFDENKPCQLKLLVMMIVLKQGAI